MSKCSVNIFKQISPYSARYVIRAASVNKVNDKSFSQNSAVLINERGKISKYLCAKCAKRIVICVHVEICQLCSKEKNS